MNKQELQAYLDAEKARFMNVYGGEVVLHAPKAPVECQRKSFNRTLDNRKKPAHLVQEEWDKYLKAVADGTYRPEYKPETDLYDYTGL